MFWYRTIGIIALCVVLALAGWAFWYEPSSLRVREYELRLAGGIGDLHVAALADLHIGSPYHGLENLERIVDRTNRSNPDLIVLLGDYVIHGVAGGKFVAPEELSPLLGKLEAPLGVWAVLGNHDWWLGVQRVRSAMETSGIRVLENQAVRIRWRSSHFWLLGIGDITVVQHDVEAALSTVTGNAPLLAITHNPDVFPEIPGRVILTIAGHTHGGQVCVPLLGRPIVPSHYGQRYALGHVTENGHHIFITTGLGASILPVRFLTPPEITILNLSGDP